jgi:hypothetical protein
MKDVAQALPSLALVACTVVLVIMPSTVTAASLAVASALWAFWFVASKPVVDDEPRFAELKAEIKELTKQIESVKAGVGMRQLR